jgi:hypothetical protein
VNMAKRVIGASDIASHAHAPRKPRQVGWT